VTLADEVADGTPLLQPVMRAGRLVAPLPSLEASRARLQRELGRLPAALTSLDPVAPPRPAISPSLVRLAEAIDAHT
jgi:nicotinate phosphoribosyltransferase